MADEQASPLDEIASVGSPHPAAPPAEPTEAPIASNLGNLDYRPEQQNQPPAGWPTYEPKPAEWSSPLDEIASVAPDKTSAIGAAGRSAARSAIPALTGLSATGSGAEIGGLIGAPLGPVGEAVGAVGGALVANYGGAKAADAVQNWALSKLPDSFVDAFGQNEKTQRLDQQQHPVASFVGGLIPYAVTMKPGPLFEKAALPENATALQRLLYNPVTARLFGGGVMGGMELASEAHDGQDLDWRKVGIATAFGTIWNKPTKLGEAITEIGAGPTRRVLGRPSPTVAQAGDLKVMGPGITEKVFQGTHEQAPEASMTAQETARAEHAALGEPPEPDVGHIARRMEPELFGRYEELLKRREAFGAWAGEGPEVSAGEGLTAPQKHLADTNAEIEAMAPQIAAAYRRAAETAGTETSEAEPFPSYAAMIAAHEHGTGQPTVKPEVPNEQAGPVPEVQAQQAQPQEGAVPGVPGVPAGGEAPGGLGGPAGAPAPVAPRPQRSIGDQRAHIAGDVARRLIAAGRPPEEAEAAGHLIAARYVTRAGRFEGKLGTPEELYARESASIAGPGGQALTPAAASSAGEAKGSDITLPTSGPATQEPSLQTTERAPPSGVFSKRTMAPSQDLGLNNVDMGMPSGRRVYHTVNNVEELERLARDSKPDLDNLLKETVDGIDGAEVYGSRAKERASVESKFTHQGREPNQVSDWLGGRIMVDSWPAMEQVIDRLKQNSNVRIVDDFMNEPKGGGYRAIHLQIMGDNGLSAEVQIQPREMTVAGEEAHKIYSKWRRREISPEEMEQAQADEAASQKLYQDAWNNFTAHAGDRPVTHGSVVQAALDARDVADTKKVPAYSQDKEGTPRGPDEPAGSFMFDPTKLEVDAKRFQFKSGGDEYGVTGALRSVQKWDPAKAQSIIVWEQNDGKLFVADGHQRAGLARRLTEQGKSKDIQLPGVLYREKDGISAGDIKAIAAVTNIANGSGSALDGAKVLRARPDLLDESLPLSAGKGKQAAALARLGDEPFKMVVNDVIPENYGAVVGDLIPKDHDRQLAAIKAIARFEPKNETEAAVLTQRVAQAELAKREEGAQASMFGDLETAESTAGEEMKIVGRAIADLKKDKSLFARVLSNAERIERTGSSIEREAARSATSEAEIFAKTLTSEAYTAGPLRTELVKAARELKDGKLTASAASARIVDALRGQAEAHGADRAGVVGHEPERELAQSDQFDFEAGAEGKPQSLIPGVAPVSARERIQALANNPMQGGNKSPPEGGLFGSSRDQQELFQRELEQKREGREHGKDFFQIKAYHGSPYDFDKFSLDKIGTGEGAQAYGHGLYFAENPAVSEAYKTSVTRNQEQLAEIARGHGLSPDAAQVLAENHQRNFGGQHFNDWLDNLKSTVENPLVDARTRAAAQNILDKSVEASDAYAKMKSPGKMYEVNINADPEHFLDWDKPLSPAMQEKLRKAAGAIKPNLYERVMGTGRDLNKWALTENLEGRTGESALAMLHRGLRSNASASQALRDAGIPGIKYLDQGSRTAGGGSHNYVLFDDKAIEITHKDGKPVSANERKNIIDEMYQRQDDAKNLDQIARGKIRIAPGQRPLISLLKDANASTFVHESGHQFLEEMLRDAAHAEAPEVVKQDTETVKKWLGVGEDGIQTKHHEKFARGFEQYMREGVAPSQGLGRVFAQFRNWLLGLYQTIKGLGQEISPEIRSVFDRMLEMEPQRTVIAPERLQPDLLHDIHEAEATHTEPHEAEGAADRIVAESNRYLTEPPKEIQNELQAASGRVQQTEVESHPTTEPGGSTSAVTGQAVPSGPGAQALVDGGAGPGTESGGGAGGAEHGAEQQGGAGPVSEGAAGAVGPDVRSKLGSHDGTALAPSPATLFGPEESPLVDKAGNIRIDNLTNRSDVAQAIRVAAQQNNEFIGDRRGVITDGQVLELADALGMDEASLNRRQLGQAFNAEQIVAARKLLVQSATHVSEAMKKAATGTDADVMAYAQAKDRHQMIQAQVAGITAEAGRALRAFRSIAGMDEAKQIGQFVQEATGKTLFQLKAEAKLGAQLQTPQQVSKFMQDAQKHTFGRMVLEYWINGLISGPATHMTYAVGNTISTLMRIPEQLVASGVGRAAAALGREGPRVHAGEAFEMAKAGLRELPSALKAGVEAVGTGVTTQLPGEHAAQGTLPFQPGSDLAQAAQFHEGATYHDALGAAFGLVRGMRDGLVSTGKLLAAGGIHGEPLVGTQYSPLGAIPDITLKGVNVLPIGSVVRAPGRLIAAIHSFYRSTNFSMEKAALAYRKGVEEGLDGEALASRVAQIRSDPSEAQMNEIAAHGATGTVLMGKGSELTQALSRVTNARIFGFPLLKFIDPFVHISGNIIEQSVIQRTPAGLLTLFNPETELARDLTGRNGGAAQDKAIGRMLVGSALSIAFGSLAAEGMMSGSGPKDPKESSLWRLAGNQAHSIRIGDFWYDTHKLGPLGMLAGISADLYDVAHDAEHGEFLKAAAHLQHAFAQNILDESFMRGPAELIQAIEDPGRYGEAYVRNFVASFVPFNVAASQITRATDPYTRQARTVIDAIKAKIPGLSETLYPRRDIWGEPMPSREVLGVPGVSAIYATRIKNDPVMTAMQQLNIFPGAVEKKVRGVELTPKEYDDFARIAGKMAKPTLDKIVNSPSWATLPAEGKHYAIQHAIEASRDAAREMIMAKYPHIPREGATIKQQRARGEKPQ